MTNFNRLINNIYGDATRMMYFYIVLGIIALFFIILIIITLIKSKKEEKKKALSEQEAPKVDLDLSTQAKEEVKEESLTETQVFNKVLLDKEALDVAKEVTPAPVGNIEVKVEEPIVEAEKTVTTDETPEVKVENPAEPVVTELPQKEETPAAEPVALENNEVVVPEEVKPEENKIEETKQEAKEEEPNFYLEEAHVEEIRPEPLVKQASDPIEVKVEDTPLELEEVKLSSIDEVKDDYTIEMPKVKPVDIDDYLNRRETEEKETPKEEVKENIVVSNDDLKSRLSKLKEKTENPGMVSDGELEDLMKAVGLEDTTVIPNVNEKDLLGK